ncbi:FIG01146831: hypothetical protein [hydrothermal vent metagenome]|uniref:TIGR02757 family protein n=1 Tax=hydrothermal vent metagenome TaxID=652676 RepID=A0A1W1EJ69_9ZZZZ
MNIKDRLDKEVLKRDSIDELSYERPDPLLVASRYKDESISLICALFAYGNANAIVKFLDTLDFELLNRSDDIIKKELSSKYYRFQKSQDVISLFIALKRLKDIDSVENIFYNGYKKENNIIDGLWEFIRVFRDVYSIDTHGYNFLVGNLPKKINQAGTYKRYFMYLRWLVRSDNVDLGLWSKIDKKDLIMPLDTHTFNVALRLGLLNRKTYDLKASIELTNKLKEFDRDDPIKYDFALYRLGQEKLA